MPGVLTDRSSDIEKPRLLRTIHTGPLCLPENGMWVIYDITGRRIPELNPAPGIYFIEIEGRITEKIIKVK
jgi:hypothetical protein